MDAGFRSAQTGKQMVHRLTAAGKKYNDEYGTSNRFKIKEMSEFHTCKVSILDKIDTFKYSAKPGNCTHQKVYL